MNEENNMIEVREVCKSYKGFSLENVSLHLPEGMILGLVGENGAGKTTLIKMILGMIRKDAGEIYTLGTDIRKNPRIKEDIGVVLDEVNLPPVMNASEIGKMMGMIYQNWSNAEFTELLYKLKIPDKKNFEELSRGNKMKLGIACALSHSPKLLILDEATSGLDPVVRDELLDLLLDFTRAEDHAILMSSHIVSDLEKVCDYIAFLHEGKLLLMEEKDAIFENYGRVVCSKDDFDNIDAKAVVGKRESAYGVEAIVDRNKISQNIKVSPVNLEELFVMMVRGEKV